jgi:hypothetical protein
MGKTKTERFVAINVTVPRWQVELAQQIGTSRNDDGEPILDEKGQPIVNTSEGIRILCDAGAMLKDVLNELESLRRNPKTPKEAKDLLGSLLNKSTPKTRSKTATKTKAEAKIPAMASSDN